MSTGTGVGIDPPVDFENRHVVVTGGTGALGTAVVTALRDAGATCYVPVFAPAELEAWPLRDRARLHVVQGIDLTQEAHVRSLYANAGPLWGSIHVVGGFGMGKLEETGADGFTTLWRLNALTCFLCCREAVAAIRRRAASDTGGGRLVNVAARASIEPRTGAGMAAYTASKAAVAALTTALGEELAGEGIWVNAVAPSIMDTPTNRAAMPDAAHGTWPSVAAVAEIILQLASPANACIRGAVVPVYGAA